MAATKPRDLTPAGTWVGTTLSNLWLWVRWEGDNDWLLMLLAEQLSLTDSNMSETKNYQTNRMEQIGNLSRTLEI